MLKSILQVPKAPILKINEKENSVFLGKQEILLSQDSSIKFDCKTGLLELTGTIYLSGVDTIEDNKND